MEEYTNMDQTAEDEAVLEAEEMADQTEGLPGLDDDLGADALQEDAATEESEEADTLEMAADSMPSESVITDDEQSAEDCSAVEAGDDEESAPSDEKENAAEGGKRPQMVTVVGVRFRTAGKAYYFSPGAYEIRRGMHVIVETARGIEYGTVVSIPMEIERRRIKSPLKEILRPATVEDDTRHQENRKKEREAYRVCFKKIREHRLEMKLIDAEYTFDNNKILFYFTADGRIDFRDLVKDLAGVFKTRIELRQIGVRDETKILGGYGSCGRPLCCHTYLSDFVPVSIKMAKEQNLSLNPTKISGVCGRLMCCLKNEEETYEELNKNLPRPGDEVEGPDGLQGEVESVNVLRQKVRILVEIDDEKELHEYPADEVTMIRRRKRGEAKHRAKRIENGQESADELRRGERKGRLERPVRANDAERINKDAEQERPSRSAESRGQEEAGSERRERRRPDRRGGQNRRGGRDSHNGMENDRRNRDGGSQREGRDDASARRGGDAGTAGEAGTAENNAAERDGREERQGGRGRDRRRRGRGRSERREGQQPAEGHSDSES